MKKLKLIFGFISLFFLALGTTFKLQYWPGASIMLLAGLALIISFFIPLFFIERIRESKSTLENLSNIFGLISFELIFAGFMFKTFHWPGGAVQLILGTGIFCFIALPTFIIAQFQIGEVKKNEIAGLVFIGFLASAFFLQSGFQYSKNIIDSFEIIGEHQQIPSDFFDEEVVKYRGLIQSNDSLQKSFDEFETSKSALLNTIAESKMLLLQIPSLDKEDVEAVMAYQRSNYDITNQIMLSTQGVLIQQYLEMYRQEAYNLLVKSGKTETANQVLKMLSTEIPVDEIAASSWYEYTFTNVPVIGVFALLDGIANEIKVVELIVKEELLAQQ